MSAVKELAIQYRMNEDIMSLSNLLTYKGTASRGGGLALKIQLTWGRGSRIENSVLIWSHTGHIRITPLGRLSCGAENVAQGRLTVDSEGCSSPWMKR